jgi:hypothetical protein
VAWRIFKAESFWSDILSIFGNPPQQTKLIPPAEQLVAIASAAPSTNSRCLICIAGTRQLSMSSFLPTSEGYLPLYILFVGGPRWLFFS